MTAVSLRSRLTIISIFVAVAVFGQQNYQLNTLVTAALKNYPIIKQKEVLYEASKISIRDVEHALLPQIKLAQQVNLGTDNGVTGSFFPLGITPSTSGGIRSVTNNQNVVGTAGVVYAEYELFNFGLNKNKILAAKSIANLQLSDLQREQYLLSLQVAKSYFKLLQVEYKLQADQQNVNRYDSVFKVIRAITLSGLKPGVDSSLAKAELSKAHITYNNTQALRFQLKEQLSFYTSIPVNQIQIEVGKFMSFQNTSLRSSIYDTNENPLLTYYTKKLNVFKINEQVVKKTYLPKVSLEGSYWGRGSSIQYNDQYKTLSTGFDLQRTNYLVGLALTYNLFNSLYQKDKIKINEYQIKASEWEYQQQRNQLNSDMAQANFAIHTTQLNLQELPIQVKSANDTYLQKIAQYRAGVASLIDLTNAAFVLYRTQIDWLETMNDYYNAALEKAAADGSLNDFIKNFKY